MSYRIPPVTLVIDRLLYRPREDREPLALVDEAIAGGISLVQLRPWSGNGDGLGAYAVAQRVREITRGKVPFVVTDDIELAERCAADGILLTAEHTYRPDDARTFLRDHTGIVGCFVTSVTGASRAERGGADYVQVGPLFGELDAPEADGALALVRKVRDAINLPVIGFGGIKSIALAKQAIDAGVNGIAVTEAVLSADDPRAASAEYVSLFDSP